MKLSLVISRTPAKEQYTIGNIQTPVKQNIDWVHKHFNLDYIYYLKKKYKKFGFKANGCYFYFPSNLLDFIKRHRMLFHGKCSVKDKHSGFHEVYCFKKASSYEKYTHLLNTFRMLL